MSFHNPQLPIHELPQATDIDYESLSPRYPLEVVLQTTISWLIPVAILIATFVFTGDLNIEILFGYTAYAVIGAILLISLSIWFSIVSARKKRLAARQHDVAYQKGVIWKRTVVLPISRIQHVELSTGPFERLFGHATLKFFTAGGSQVDLKIPGLEQERAERLRLWLLQQIEDESEQKIVPADGESPPELEPTSPTPDASDHA